MPAWRQPLPAHSSSGTRPPSTTNSGRAVFRALAAPGVYLELVVESRWTVEAFERWLADVLEGHLFAGGRSGASER